MARANRQGGVGWVNGAEFSDAAAGKRSEFSSANRFRNCNPLVRRFPDDGEGVSNAMRSGPLPRLLDVRPHETRAVWLAFACNFVLMASYYLLRPVRDAMATVFGVDQLQSLFTGTLVLTLVLSPAFAWLTGRVRLSRLLPGVFGFLIVNLLGFYLAFGAAPQGRALAATYYWWFSVFNLFMISIFWSLVVDVFTPSQATRLLPAIAASGSLGAIAGPLVVTFSIAQVGTKGLLLVASGGLLLVIVLVHQLIREKARMQEAHVETQATTLDHRLRGTVWDGIRTLFSSPYQLNQALFMVLMTWVSTVGYFIQTEMISHAFANLDARTLALANIDLAVNVISALVALLGTTWVLERIGVRGGLVLTPLVTAASFVAMAVSSTLPMLQAMQAVRRIGQYALARPSREVCFTVVDQEARYKTKNLIDVVAYRVGDVGSAWAQAGLRAMGYGTGASLGFGVAVSLAWGASAWALGSQYNAIRAAGQNSGSTLPGMSKG